jgi:hypothetical protein
VKQHGDEHKMHLTKLWRLALVFGILVGVVGCQSALYNTYSVPGETAGGGLRYYNSSFPRGEKPDPWEGQGQETVEPEREKDAEKEEATGSSASP